MDDPNWVETSSTEQLPVVVAVEQAAAVNLRDCETIMVGVIRQHYIQPSTLAHSNPHSSSTQVQPSSLL